VIGSWVGENPKYVYYKSFSLASTFTKYSQVIPSTSWVWTDLKFNGFLWPSSIGSANVRPLWVLNLAGIQGEANPGIKRIRRRAPNLFYCNKHFLNIVIELKFNSQILEAKNLENLLRLTFPKLQGFQDLRLRKGCESRCHSLEWKSSFFPHSLHLLPPWRYSDLRMRRGRTCEWTFLSYRRKGFTWDVSKKVCACLMWWFGAETFVSSTVRFLQGSDECWGHELLVWFFANGWWQCRHLQKRETTTGTTVISLAKKYWGCLSLHHSHCKSIGQERGHYIRDESDWFCPKSRPCRI